jgi:hypothetical protein
VYSLPGTDKEFGLRVAQGESPDGLSAGRQSLLLQKSGRVGGLSFDETDVFTGSSLEPGLFLECSDVPDGLEDMDGFLEKTQDIGRVDINAVFFDQECADLPVVKTVLAEFDDLPGKLLLGASAVGGLTTFTAEEGGQEREDLVTENVIKAINVQARGDGIKGCPMKGKVRDTVADSPFDLSCMPEPCPFSDQ